MELPVPLELLAIAGAVTFLSALLQGSIGFGFALSSVAILTFVDPRLTPGPQLFLVLLIGLAVLLRERTAADFIGAGWILAGRLAGGVVGTTLLIVLTDTALNVLLASLILIAVAAIVLRRPIPRTRATKLGTGIVSEVMSTISAIGGPPIALLYADAKGPVVRTTLSIVFIIGVLISMSGRAFAGKLAVADFVIAMWLLPAAVLGFLASGPLTKRIDGEILKSIILVVCAVAAVGILIRTLT